MLGSAGTRTTLMEAAFPAIQRGGVAATAAMAVAGSLLLWVSAKVHVPFWPVPMTMQTFAVLLIGMLSGWRLGGLTLLVYLIEGAAGLPVFSGTPERGIGFSYMAGPTGGYLLGFLAAAVLVGGLAERGCGRRAWTALAAFVIGDAVIMILGWGWLAVLIGPAKAWTGGVAPFLLGETVKVALLTTLVPVVWRAVGHGRP